MLRKVINPDGTFGGNFDERLKDSYRSSGSWPEESYIEVTQSQANIIDEYPGRYIYKPEVVGLFNGDPMGVIENPEWSVMEFEAARKAKYAEITDKYDYANQYYVCNITGNKYANVSWIPTWAKVINLCESQGVAVIPSPVRYYVKNIGESKFRNENFSDIEVATLKYQLNLLEKVQFSILQPRRNKFYEQLEAATTLDQIGDIVVNYGSTINEQDVLDVNSKVEL